MTARWGGGVLLVGAVAILLLLVSRCESDDGMVHRRRAFAVADVLSTVVEESVEVVGLVEGALADDDVAVSYTAPLSSALISAGTGDMHEPALHGAARRALDTLRQKIASEELRWGMRGISWLAAHAGLLLAVEDLGEVQRTIALGEASQIVVSAVDPSSQRTPTCDARRLTLWIGLTADAEVFAGLAVPLRSRPCAWSFEFTPTVPNASYVLNAKVLDWDRRPDIGTVFDFGRELDECSTLQGHQDYEEYITLLPDERGTIVRKSQDGGSAPVDAQGTRRRLRRSGVLDASVALVHTVRMRTDVLDAVGGLRFYIPIIGCCAACSHREGCTEWTWRSFDNTTGFNDYDAPGLKARSVNERMFHKQAALFPNATKRWMQRVHATLNDVVCVLYHTNAASQAASTPVPGPNTLDLTGVRPSAQATGPYFLGCGWNYALGKSDPCANPDGTDDAVFGSGSIIHVGGDAALGSAMLAQLALRHGVLQRIAGGADDVKVEGGPPPPTSGTSLLPKCRMRLDIDIGSSHSSAHDSLDYRNGRWLSLPGDHPCGDRPYGDREAADTYLRRSGRHQNASDTYIAEFKFPLTRYRFGGARANAKWRAGGVCWYLDDVAKLVTPDEDYAVRLLESTAGLLRITVTPQELFPSRDLRYRYIKYISCESLPFDLLPPNILHGHCFSPLRSLSFDRQSRRALQV